MIPNIDTGTSEGGGTAPDEGSSSAGTGGSTNSRDSDPGELNVTATAGGGRGPRFDDDVSGEVVTEDPDGNNVAVTGDALNTVVDPFRSDETRQNDVESTENSSVSDVVDTAAAGEDASQFVQDASDSVTQNVPDAVPTDVSDVTNDGGIDVKAVGILAVLGAVAFGVFN